VFNQSQIKKILKDYNIRPRKELGQSFLIDKNVNNKILKLINPNEDDVIVEIGAGFGNLALPLAHRAFSVYAIEKDKKIAEILKRNLSTLNNAHVIISDVLKINFADILNKVSSRKIRAVGNLPYYISSSIIFHLLTHKNFFDEAFLMLQKEVAVRLTAGPSSKDYGILSCLLSPYAEIKKLMEISRNSFYPKPKVDSSLVKIKFLREAKYKIENEKLFARVVKSGFSKRRKQILNALSASQELNIDKESISLALNEANIDYKKRAEDIKVKDFVKLSNLLNERLKEIT
jgi:16S rRNA (adenine1518-N6/adenine1519-N6)-dimethyltransferase